MSRSVPGWRSVSIKPQITKKNTKRNEQVILYYFFDSLHTLEMNEAWTMNEWKRAESAGCTTSWDNSKGLLSRVLVAWPRLSKWLSNAHKERRNVPSCSLCATNKSDSRPESVDSPVPVCAEGGSVHSYYKRWWFLVIVVVFSLSRNYKQTSELFCRSSRLIHWKKPCCSPTEFERCLLSVAHASYSAVRRRCSNSDAANQAEWGATCVVSSSIHSTLHLFSQLLARTFACLSVYSKGSYPSNVLLQSEENSSI